MDHLRSDGAGAAAGTPPGAPTEGRRVTAPPCLRLRPPHVRRRPPRSVPATLSLALIVTLVATALGAPPAFADRSTRAEQRLLSLMARDRGAAGAPAWGAADDLTASAVRWSARMAAEFGADGGQRHNPDLRSEVCCARRIAENVGWTSGGHDDLDGAIDRLHAAFMGSDGHRANVLHPSHTHVGVGVELHASGNLYVTVVFREPNGSAPAAAPAPSGGSTSDPAPEAPVTSTGASPSSASTTTSNGATPTRTPPEPPTDRAGPAASTAGPQAAGATEDTPSVSAAADAEALDDLARRGPEELARLATWVLAEHERRSEAEALLELEAVLATLGAAPAKLVHTLRRALKLGADRSVPGARWPEPAA
jgi:uncharacterized protein YkwD